MTTLPLLIGFAVCAAIGLLVALLHLGRRSPGRGRDLALLGDDRLAMETYRPVGRLLSTDDVAFVCRQKGYRRGMERRLSRDRRKVLSLYLEQLRRDFRQVWAVCRLLAPISRNPEFGALVSKQYLMFYSLYWILQLRCKLGLCLPLQVEVYDLVSPLQQLQQGALRALRSLDEEAQATMLASH